MKEEINIRIGELRLTVKRVIEMVTDIAGEPEEKISLKTAINNDLGIQGDDWDLFLEELDTKFNCQLYGLNFYDYFIDEAQIVRRLLIVFPLLPVKVIGFLFLLPFNKLDAIKFWRKDVFPKLPDLTAGDLVTSIIEKKWAPRSTRYFNLI